MDNELNLEKWIRKIDSFKQKSEPGTYRLAFSNEDILARKYIMGLMQELGMQVSVDGVGNVFGCLRGQRPELPAVWTGSHIDTVKEAGMFDGVAGVAAGLEAVRMIRKSGQKPLRSIYVNIYTCEESTVLGSGCIGSRALAGHLKEEDLDALTDLEGNTLRELLKRVGLYDEKKLAMLFAGQRPDIKASVELHIEQGPWLEKENISIGLVDYICAPTNLLVTLQGVQSHAGGTSMENRRDALAAMAEISVAFESIVKQTESAYSTGTIGYVSVSPNAVNVIPGKVTFSIDIRDCDGASKEQLTEKLIACMNEITKRRGIKMQIEEKCRDNPMKCETDILNMMEQICKDRNISSMRMISGAYHDSLFLGELAPVAMLFVPSRNGISHSPKEWTDFSQIAKGAAVLKEVLWELANT